MNMTDLMKLINETCLAIQDEFSETPEVGIILGSGLGNLAKQIKVKKEIPYSSIPHFPVSTVEGHSGKLIFGELGGKIIVAMAGRFHYYEGYSAQQIAYPVRVMKLLGCKTLMVSNAAGSVNSNYKVGDLMLINDQISFFVPNPLIGKNELELGVRFPDMSEPYSLNLIEKAKKIAADLNIQVHEGIYCAVTGPTFETHAEYKLIKIIGSDVVGMSTVQEVIAAKHCGMNVFGISVITDVGIRDDNNKITHEEVLEAANNAEPKMTSIFTNLIAQL